MATRTNKRRSERVPADVPVVWVRRGRRDQIRTADISHEGMFLLTPEQIDPGQLVQLEVQLPGEKHLLVFAATRFCGRTVSGPGVGVQIYVISDHDRRRWQAYYRASLKQRVTAAPPPLPAAAIGA